MSFLHRVHMISDSSVQNLKDESANEVTSQSETEGSTYPDRNNDGICL